MFSGQDAPRNYLHYLNNRKSLSASGDILFLLETPELPTAVHSFSSSNVSKVVWLEETLQRVLQGNTGISLFRRIMKGTNTSIHKGQGISKYSHLAANG